MTSSNAIQGGQIGFISKIRNELTDMSSGLRFRKIKQKLWVRSLFVSGNLTIVLLLGTIATMVSYGWPFFKDIQGFIEIISTNNWYPADEWGAGHYGALAMIYGTFFVGIPALIISIVLGISTAVVLSEYVPQKISRKIQPIIEYIAAIPSVIFGVIAFIYMDKIIKFVFGVSSGRGPLNASITLAIMATPIIVSISYDALQSTPPMQRHAAKAFGATRYEVFRAVVLPHAFTSISASILLAFSRVLGETMVVLMILGNSPVIKWSFFKPAYTLTSAIANEIGDARFGSAEFSVLFVLALILLIFSFLIILISNLITTKNKYFFSFLSLLFIPIRLLGGTTRDILQLFAKQKEMNQQMIESRIKKRMFIDYLVQAILSTILLTLIGMVFTFLFLVLKDGVAEVSIRFIMSFPTFSSLFRGEYGIYGAIIGSGGLVLLSALIAFPIATATGVYLSEFAKPSRLKNFIQMAIINISAIPSIVVGLFVYGAFSVALKWESGILPGSIALGIMMLPIVTTNTIEALRNVPQYHKYSALALGASHWEAVSKHRLPYALPSIITGYVLAMARVIGETAPLLLTAAAFTYAESPYPSQLIQEPIRALPFEIYYNLLFSTWQGAAGWALGTAVVLLILVALLNTLAYALRILIRKKYEYNGNI
ncbi:MAG: phosphate ABC transporter permease subunit PstC [Candidatus Heimdallarchaeota archaeon]|nr:phosphate ABC transporter permease subunit PstC [Candidatus Heimdallarchaeota archaeon]